MCDAVARSGRVPLRRGKRAGKRRRRMATRTAKRRMTTRDEMQGSGREAFRWMMRKRAQRRRVRQRVTTGVACNSADCGVRTFDVSRVQRVGLTSSVACTVYYKSNLAYYQVP